MEMQSPIDFRSGTARLRPIRELRPDEMRNLLLRNIFGRLGYVRDGEIHIVPLNYAFRDGSIFIRTGSAGKLDFLDDGVSEVTFQVDEIQSTRWWRSVQIRGLFERVDREMGDESWMRALGMIRRLQPRALRRNDEFPERTEIFRIHIHAMTGRARG